ncbi:OmpA family protein [Parahaliea mediterranea]|uniref:OmpA family protein n=1 Tax=Parahaliea mediterranea TaxID=651086 RepID=A0A939DIY0_9GAMM|nr:OmpA family protein [Parahaliea mediterranea]MBN7798382.1 OmpA family protein [Parahaliea mediterranea]
MFCIKPGQWLAIAFTLAIALAGCQSLPRLTEEQVAVLKQEGFQLTDEGWEFGLSSKVLFGNDDATVNEQSRGELLRLGRTLRGVGITQLRLEGHTDSYGEDGYNQALSERRAWAVARVLVAAGMREEDLTVRGLGEEIPVADNNTDAGRQENRRVAIIVPAL